MKTKSYLFAFVVLLFAIQVFILFVPPQIGIANNSDFSRIIALFDLYYVPDYNKATNFFDVFVYGRPFGAPTYNGYMATSSLFIWIACGINYIINIFTESDNTFYIYSLSAVYVVVYSVAFYLLLSVMYKLDKVKFIILGFLSIFLLCDVLFLEYFNSFYQEAGFIVCFLLFCAIFLKYKSWWLDVIALWLVVLTKEQNLIYLLLFFPIFAKYKITFGKGLISIIIIGSVFFVYNGINNYNKVYNRMESMSLGLLHNQTEPQAAEILSSIKLNPEYAIFAGRYYWGNLEYAGNDASKQELLQQMAQDVTMSKVLLGYMLHPNLFFANIYDYLKTMYDEGPFASNLGNYKANYSTEVKRASFMSYVSSYVLKYIFVIYLLNLLFLFYLCACSRKLQITFFNERRHVQTSHQERNQQVAYAKLSGMFSRIYKENSLLIILNLIGILSIFVNIIGSGFIEVVKHSVEIYYLECFIFIYSVYLLFLNFEISRIDKKDSIKI